MSYHFDPDPDFDREPQLDAFGGGIIRIPLGVDFEADLVIYMTVDLFCLEKEAGIHDIRFGTEEMRLSREGFSEGMDYSIAQSRRYVPKDHRAHILDLLIIALDSLVKNLRPNRVTMQSYYSNLPAKALIKYDRITTCMTDNGYVVAENYAGTNGCRYWLFNLED